MCSIVYRVLVGGRVWKKLNCNRHNFPSWIYVKESQRCSNLVKLQKKYCNNLKFMSSCQTGKIRWHVFPLCLMLYLSVPPKRLYIHITRFVECFRPGDRLIIWNVYKIPGHCHALFLNNITQGVVWNWALYIKISWPSSWNTTEWKCLQQEYLHFEIDRL